MFKCEQHKSKMDNQAWLLLFIRIFVGLVFILHGLAKAGNLEGFSELLTSISLPLPGALAIIIAYFEIIAGAFLLLGLLVRITGILLVIEMALVLLMAAFSSSLNLSGISLEYNILLILITLYLAVTSIHLCGVCCLKKTS